MALFVVGCINPRNKPDRLWPGLISKEDANLAAEKGVLLEITARTGHSLTNGYVVRLAEDSGAGLVFGSDSHSPHDLVTKEFAGKLIEGAGLPPGSLSSLMSNARQLLEKIGILI